MNNNKYRCQQCTDECVGFCAKDWEPESDDGYIGAYCLVRMACGHCGLCFGCLEVFMSEAKFTKGPWVARTHDGELKHAVIYLNGGGFNISNCPDSVANAHLIAAAPEMYHLLEKLREHYNFSEYCEKEIDDTLSKARGEQ